jgi:hypothetical protein
MRKLSTVILLILLALLIASACGGDGQNTVGARTPEPSPAETPLAATPTPVAACPGPEELAPYWPPHGSVTLSHYLPRINVDIPPVPFEQVDVLGEFPPVDPVEVLDIACGDARGQGQEAYVAYQATLPPGPLWQEGAVLTVLAALDLPEGSLVNIGTLPEGTLEGRLHLQDLTSDGRDEIIFDRPGGATWGTTSVWSWQDGNLREVFRGGSYLGETEPRDLDGDGTLEVLTHQRLDGLRMSWPRVYRWDGYSFRPALFADIYDDFIAESVRALESGTFKEYPDDEITVRITLGHVYERQGRTAEARAEYDQAWALYEATAPQPRRCAGAAQAVQEFYLAQATEGMKGLTSAYSMLGEGLRQAQPFADFAADFARTESVMLVGPPEVFGQEDELSQVFVRVVSHELTPQGDVIERFAVIWQVRQEGGSCILESVRESGGLY